jgi:hypothetical protein
MHKIHNTYKNKDVGFLFSAITLCSSIYMYLEESLFLASTFLILGLMLLLLSVVKPVYLSPLTKIWHLFGYTLGKITSPIILGVIFFGIITPIAILTRFFGRDELRLKIRPINSCWIKRESGDLISDSFKNQY